MAVLRVFATLLFLLLFLCPTSFCYSTEDVKKWCSQTPHPQPCEYFLTHNSGHMIDISIHQKSDFLEISKQLALEHALKAKSNVLSLGNKCRNDLEKAAWSDCLELYDHTILRLNKTLDRSGTKCTKTDSQTWLSTALTNLETCRTGFVELGVSDYIFPLMSNNVSKLISNVLATNDVPYSEPEYKKFGFPTWVKGGDRKLLLSSSPAYRANVVVAKDGSGNYRTIQEAIITASKAKRGSKRYVIYVKQGTYKEYIEIDLNNIMLVGDGIGKTIITGSRSVGGGSTTYNSSTVAVVGNRFIARDITFQNTAGAANNQAVALRSMSDHSVFYKCSIEGYQDTLYVHSERQFYRECDIYGTVDFIFGNAAVVFQNCNIYARYPPNKTNTITAQGRTDPHQNTGISIHASRVMAASDLQSFQSSIQTYLGRPWKNYSRTVIMQTYLDSLIEPAGWMEWSGDFALKTLYYGEYANTGPGSSTANRVNWPGYHVITSASTAARFTVAKFIGGHSWLPYTKVPYTADL